MQVNQFWNRVRNLLKSSGISQETLAKACKIPYATVKGWMSKNYWPPVNDVAVIARYLNVSIDYLVFGKETDTGQELKKIHALLRNIEKSFAEIESLKI